MATELEDLVKVPMDVPIDPSIVSNVLAQSPFVSITGTFNTRDICGPTNSSFRRGYVFRSGTLETIPDNGKEALRDSLNIKTVFDLRSLQERQQSPLPDIPDIDVVWVPSTLDNTTTIPAQKPSDREFTYVIMYLDILTSHASACRTVLEHIRDHPNKPFLFHCTAGKDRTGALAWLILSLADVPEQHIALDYALTRIGIEPVREFLLHKLTGGKPVDFSAPRMKVYASLAPDAMMELTRAVNREYGSVEGYVTRVLGLSMQDVEIIKQNLKKA